VIIQAPSNEREATHLPGVVGALQRNGFTPIRHGHAEYQLVFTIETGPINADATISLSQAGRVVAQARGRDGGPRIILNRSAVVATAVQRALEQFDNELVQLGRAPMQQPHYPTQPQGFPMQQSGYTTPRNAPLPYSQGPYGQIQR
jgi:hypothetical protein